MEALRVLYNDHLMPLSLKISQDKSKSKCIQENACLESIHLVLYTYFSDKVNDTEWFQHSTLIYLAGRIMQTKNNLVLKNILPLLAKIQNATQLVVLQKALIWQARELQAPDNMDDLTSYSN